MRELDAELSMPLAELLAEVVVALRRRPFRDRIADAGLPTGAPPAAGDDESSG